jgi:hypothetical protein
MKAKTLWALTALSLTVFLSGCGEKGLSEVAQIRGVAEANAQWPDLPSDCRIKLSEAGRAGERLDSAYLRVSGLLAAQDARIDRCATWYDGQRVGRMK